MASPFSKGKYALSISDRDGQAYPYPEMVKEWTGALVHISEYEPKSPLIDPKVYGSDPQALRNARPARVAPAVTQLMPYNPFVTYGSGSSYINVHVPNHGLTDSSTYRFRGMPTTSGYVDPQTFDGITGAKIALAAGYTIRTGKWVSGARDTDYTTNWFYFVVDTDTATTGGIEGGGYPVSVGPVTIAA
jgi:hypothetical protein